MVARACAAEARGEAALSYRIFFDDCATTYAHLHRCVSGLLVDAKRPKRLRLHPADFERLHLECIHMRHSSFWMEEDPERSDRTEIHIAVCGRKLVVVSDECQREYELCFEGPDL